MEKKQSSIEWLEQNMPDLSNYIPIGVSLELHAKFQQAKAMHKEEIEKAWYDGISGGECGSREQYYNETFGENN